ncbi:AAA family ATPase [Bacillus mycoides]|uniref:AAA family ATPase n=1 Tax=Bacillus mycoides TaxID=1405 RepID=UPI002E075560|nr:AAA family ATPase [Bacillus mycoides]MEC5238943.1 AAA family ATPase [Bacillus mycoides]MEC5262847.1 AAA family ATPase [Bacillus mycoides]
MRWSLDTHKYISEITRKALQIMVEHGITSGSSESDIDAVEHDLASANIYKSYDAAKGRVRRALFTYFKAYGCLNQDEQQTEVGKVFGDNTLSIQEFCFYFIVNYKYSSGEISYYPVELILKFIKMMESVSSEEAYLTPYDFSKLVECNSVVEINDEFIHAALEARKKSPIDVEERKIGYDVWSKMLVNAGVFEKTSTRTLIEKSTNLGDWILSAYQQNNTVVKGEIVTGILSDIPIVPCGQFRNWEQYVEEGEALQAFLFEGLEFSVIEKYIKKTRDTSFETVLSDIGLSNSVSGYYKDFIGLEKLVAFRLLNHPANSCQIIGRILLNSNVASATIEDEELLIPGANKIFYGAPGTGKSHTLDEKSKGFDYLERVTFYPDFTRDDFIGCFMPSMSYVKDNAIEYIVADGTSSSLPGKPVPYYTFVPGPFTNALVEAYKYPNKNVLLIVEELNRANAAAIFGEFFQLLDRKDNGESKYSISISNEYSEYLSSKIESYSKGQKVIIPKNLSLYATMNSSDQGVNPLDAAFKRRWSFTYIPINFANVEHKNYEIQYGTGKVTWESFATRINNELKKKGMNEDKHLGQYFITKAEIADLFTFASKILLYLFDDVLKFNRRGFFKMDYNTFSDLLTGFINGEKVFEFEFPPIVQEIALETGNIVDKAASDERSMGKGFEELKNNYTEPLVDKEVSRVVEGDRNELQDKVF